MSDWDPSHHTTDVPTEEEGEGAPSGHASGLGHTVSLAGAATPPPGRHGGADTRRGHRAAV